MSNYAWLITTDHTDSGEGDAGVMGPKGHKMTEGYIAAKGKLFRMYDDDNILYYTGFYVGDGDGFEPLDDFGMPGAGCTAIKYKQPSGKWETL